MFKTRAAEQIAALSSARAWIADDADALDSELNPGGVKPKRGSFEISVVRDDGQTVEVWSGLKLGPPRRLKFPEADVLLKAVQDALNKK